MSLGLGDHREVHLVLANRLIPLAEPAIGGNAWAYVKSCLDSGWVSSSGPVVTEFERTVADYLGCRYAVATSSGTAALHLALLAAGVQRDDEVLLPALTFIAPANAVRYCNAWPAFIDVEPAHLQLDPDRLEEYLTDNAELSAQGLLNRTSGRPIRALIPVDLLGHPADWDRLRSIAERFRLALVEDASESLGATYRGRRVGALGDVACLSFNGNKIVTTGGGGMVLTDNRSWADRARYLSTQAKDDPHEHIHGELGYNYRLTGLQAALGLSQMEQLDRFVAAKRGIATRYLCALKAVPGVTLPREAPDATSTYWLYTLRIDPQVFGMSSRALALHLEAQGIGTRPLWQPLTLSLPYGTLLNGYAPVAEAVYADALSVPCSVCLSKEDQDIVIDAILRHHSSGGGSATAARGCMACARQAGNR